jgi:hypothetical protein
MNPSGWKLLFLGTCFAAFTFVFFSHKSIGDGDLGMIVFHGEAKILGRLAESRTEGVFSYAGLLGGCKAVSNPAKIYEYGYQTFFYEKHKKCDDYGIYKSQSGGQALLYSLFDRMHVGLTGLRFIVSASLALALSFLVYWIWLTFGFWVAVVGVLSILCMRGLALFGDNISQVLSVDYLVFVTLLFAYYKKWSRIGLIVFCTMVLKYVLSGFEYLTVVWIMALIPSIFYAIKDDFPVRQFWKDVRRIAAGIAAATLVALIILALQVGSVTSFKDIGDHVYRRILTRTQFQIPGERDIYYKAMQKNNLELASTYLGAPAAHMGNFSINFSALIIMLSLSSMAALYINRGRKDKTIIALVASAITGCISALIWIFLMKGHSAYHTFIDPIVWHMPFSIFCFVLAAVVVQSLFKKAR